jgi:hypothetical protein
MVRVSALVGACTLLYVLLEIADASIVVAHAVTRWLIGKLDLLRCHVWMPLCEVDLRRCREVCAIGFFHNIQAQYPNEYETLEAKLHIVFAAVQLRIQKSTHRATWGI